MAILKIKGLRERLEIDNETAKKLKTEIARRQGDFSQNDPWIDLPNGKFSGRMSHIDFVILDETETKQQQAPQDYFEPLTPEEQERNRKKMAELREHMKNLKNGMSVTD